MIDILSARFRQGYRTMKYPAGPPPGLPDRFVGSPLLDCRKCDADCADCINVCPCDALSRESPGNALQLDTGKCIFCGACAAACTRNAIGFNRDHRLAAANRDDLVVTDDAGLVPRAFSDAIRRQFGRSLKLRQVSAGGCNACEADTNVLNTLAWDLGRFGIQFVAAPRHADGLLVTGPVTENMALALRKTYDAVPAPRIVIAVGACAVSGGLFRSHAETCRGVDTIIPVDLHVPGCPPHPLTILDGLLRMMGRVVEVDPQRVGPSMRPTDACPP